MAADLIGVAESAQCLLERVFGVHTAAAASLRIHKDVGNEIGSRFVAQVIGESARAQQLVDAALDRCPNLKGRAHRALPSASFMPRENIFHDSRARFITFHLRVVVVVRKERADKALESIVSVSAPAAIFGRFP